MIKTLIIGKQSNLSKQLYKSLENSFLISAREIKKDINVLAKFKDMKINIIFNNFQQSIELNNLDNVSEYITNSILITSMILDYFKENEINKIIYTSSSSVYGNNIFCSENDEVKPLNLHAALKVSNEKLVEKYCIENKINYTITRIFNMYGGEDKFSVISKILNAIKNDSEISIVNGGNAIRDFIHIDDVVEIYINLLKLDVNILNVGTGEGTSIKSLLDFLIYRDWNLNINNIQRAELKASTANITFLNSLIEKNSFRKLENYLLKELQG